MSLSMLVNNGAECGPSNPLQGLSKRFDQDRDIQQDHIVAGRAGPSRQTFRTQGVNGFSDDQDARNFFSGQNQPLKREQLSLPFDLAPLAQALPSASQISSPPPQTGITAPIPAPWAADFLTQQPQPLIHQTAGPSTFIPQHAQARSETAPVASVAPFAPVFHGYRPAPAITSPININAAQQLQSSQEGHTTHLKALDWEHAFSSLEAATQELSSQSQQQNETQGRPQQHDSDLAKAAALVLEQVKEETNPKFKNSQFMKLMQDLKAGEVVVEGNDMVRASEGSTSSSINITGPSLAEASTANLTSSPLLSSDTKGKGKARDYVADYFAGVDTETDNDRYFAQENEEYIAHQQRYHMTPTHFAREENIAHNWGLLHDQWERFEPTAIGIKEIPFYPFQHNNPYLNSERTRNHSMHSMDNIDPLWDSVLEREAAVQNNPTNAQAWFELGVKQQENEQEPKALIALRRAVDADPNHLPSWLALAVSLTNESDHKAAYKAIHEWVTRSTQESYRAAISEYQAKHEARSFSEDYGELIECLIAMARSEVDGQVDADVQIALAVLLNGHEEYEKAQDCFRSALSVRPFDWLLYNRVGATLANSGRAEEALGFYARALELHPGYIRARFNMGISCINLRRHEEAVQHILDALSLQDSEHTSDSAGMNEARGVVSAALWDTLKTACLHMQRLDLATLCDRKDLERFRGGYFSDTNAL